MLIGYYIIVTDINKHKPKQPPTKFNWLRPWYFLILAIISGTVCLYALRANNQHMNELRDAVYAADKSNTDVQGALKSLQGYVTTHMNTNLSTGANAVYPPIQLKYTYQRLTDAQNAQFVKGSSIYNDAQHYCEGQNSSDFSGRNRVPCIEQYVQSHSTTKLPTVPDSLYKFSFASPRWSPDLAGWSLLATIASSGLFFAILAYQRLTKALLK
jgi:hypothetical protein